MTNIDLLDNPFFVLELDGDATAVAVERQGKRLLAELELGRANASHYASPFGTRPRDEAAVRRAMATLRDPRRRAVYARFVPPKHAWDAADEAEAAARVEDAPRAWPELSAWVPRVPQFLRALLGAGGPR